jgi:hypothetical protein
VRLTEAEEEGRTVVVVVIVVVLMAMTLIPIVLLALMRPLLVPWTAVRRGGRAGAGYD